METALLDLLDALTEARVTNPHLRPSVLAALRLATGAAICKAGRLLVLRHDGALREIIAHGEPAQDEAADLVLLERAREARLPAEAQLGDLPITAWPLGKGKRVHAVLILERPAPGSGQLLGDVLLQWCAMAEVATLEKAELIDENHQLREELRAQFSERNVVAVSGSMRRVLDSAARVAASTATVLIQGETGTGKEMIARLIHEHSPRVNKAFIAVNCGALSESLLESELFGHVKGAFTGAVADRKGRFEAADGGTVFLDEIGEVSQGMQVRLLRVLQEMEVQRVGDTVTRKLDVRVVAATNRNLEVEVQRGSFRADLFYRLNVVHLQVPPLRQRPEDIPHLFEHFLSRFCQQNVKYIESVHPEVLATMARYPWPGNIRELENCVEKMVVMAPGREITPDLLPMPLVAFDPHAEGDRQHGLASFEDRIKSWMQSSVHHHLERGGTALYDEVRAKWERYLFEAVLAATQDNKSKAAQVLGITRNTLAARLKELCDVKREWTVV